MKNIVLVLLFTNVTLSCSKNGSNIDTHLQGFICTVDYVELKDNSSAKIKFDISFNGHIYTHHVHHKTSKDIGKVNIESLRSASGTDSWHDRNGYRSIKAIEGFLHDPEHGQIARISHIF